MPPAGRMAAGKAEKGAETVELDALECLRNALAHRRDVVGRDAVDLDRVEFVESLALKHRQRRYVEIGKAEIGEEDDAALCLGAGGEGLGEPRIAFGIERDKRALRGHRF